MFATAIIHFVVVMERWVHCRARTQARGSLSLTPKSLPIELVPGVASTDCVDDDVGGGDDDDDGDDGDPASFLFAGIPRWADEYDVCDSPCVVVGRKNKAQRCRRGR